MPSLVAEQHIKCNHLIQIWDHDPDTASAAVVSPDAGTTKRYLDMRDHDHFAAAAINSVLVGAGITKLEIVAASDQAGANLTVIKDSGTVAANTLNKWLIEECAADEIAQASAASGLNLRYVAARLTLANMADEAKVVYFTDAKRRYLDLTPATTLA